MDSVHGESILGGTQDNGSPYISGHISPIYYQDAVELGGGDGGGCAISSLNPNGYYVSADNNSLMRSANLSGLGSPSNVYTNTKGLNKGANIDSVASISGVGCFVNPIALYENSYDTMTLDSMLWVSNAAFPAGTIIYPTSSNGGITFPYMLSKAVNMGDSVIVQNRVVSKLAEAFTPSNGVWLMMQAADFQDPVVWMPIGGPLSKPNAFSGSDPVHCMAWSPNGDALFVGTQGGQLYRFSNLDSIIDTAYTTGALFSMPNGGKSVTNTKCRVISTSLTSALGVSGRDILSIAVDPKNGNNVIVTLGNYGNSSYVYYSSNALSASPTFKSIQGSGLPKMPVYGAVLDVTNGWSFPNGAVIATEHGIYSCTNVNTGIPTWTADNAGMANTLVCAIKQQTLPAWECNNSGNFYIGTHGRGAWMDSTFFSALGVKQITNTNSVISAKVYPNPANSMTNIQFTLAKEAKVSITIYDLQGRVVQEIPVANDAPGQHNVTINTYAMQPGAYLATITGEGFRQTCRFVVVR
jgi:hypothetical protein